MQTCKNFQFQLLLKQSGELPQKNCMALERHIHACGSCAAFWHDLASVRTAALSALDHDSPSAAVLARIQAAAAQRHGKSFPRILLRPAIFAMAVALLMMLAGLAVIFSFGNAQRSQALQTALPRLQAPIIGTSNPNVAMAMMLDSEIEDELAQRLFHDENFIVEKAHELLQQNRVSDLDLDIMFLECLAI